MQITAGDIGVDLLRATVIDAINSYTGTAKINQAMIQTLQVGNANITDLDASKISSGLISSNRIDTDNLSVKMANVSGTLNASKIRGGVLDISSVNIASTTGKLTIADNTIWIEDNQSTPVVRVQIGENNVGQYGILVMNANGQVIFDSDKGVLIPEGLANNVVSTDKIKDKAVGLNKLNLDELFVSGSAFIQNLQTVELNANQLTTGQISGERINMKGLVSYECLDPDMQEKFIFDTNGNKTYINGNTIATNTIYANQINIKGYLNVTNSGGLTTFKVDELGNVEISGLIQSDNFVSGRSGYRFTRNGDIEINSAVIRASIDAGRAGISNEGTGDNAIRFYAGGTKEDSPFKVYDNGRVVATNAELGGLFTGTLKIGNVFIADTTNSDGAIEIKTNDDLETLVNIQGYSTSYFTNNLEVGRDLSNVLSVMPADGKVNINNGASFNLTNGRFTTRCNFLYGDYYEINNTKNSISSFTYKTLVDKNNSVYYSVSGIKGDNGDFIFTRADGDTDVKVEGTLKVKNEITGIDSAIVCRFTDTKVSFFATA